MKDLPWKIDDVSATLSWGLPVTVFCRGWIDREGEILTNVRIDSVNVRMVDDEPFYLTSLFDWGEIVSACMGSERFEGMPYPWADEELTASGIVGEVLSELKPSELYALSMTREAKGVRRGM